MRYEVADQQTASDSGHAVAEPAARRDAALEAEFATACRLVTRPVGEPTSVTLVVEAKEPGDDAFWAALNARVAELAWQYGVEIWLALDGTEIRARIRPYQPEPPPAPRALTAAPSTDRAERGRLGWRARWHAAIEGVTRREHARSGRG